MHADREAATAAERAQAATQAQAAAEANARQLRARVGEAEDAQRRLAAQLQEHAASVAQQHSTLVVCAGEIFCSKPDKYVVVGGFCTCVATA